MRLNSIVQIKFADANLWRKLHRCRLSDESLRSQVKKKKKKALNCQVPVHGIHLFIHSFTTRCQKRRSGKEQSNKESGVEWTWTEDRSLQKKRQLSLSTTSYLQLGKKTSPDKGLEPLTLRLKVWCSTDWANRASIHKDCGAQRFWNHSTFEQYSPSTQRMRVLGAAAFQFPNTIDMLQTHCLILVHFVH